MTETEQILTHVLKCRRVDLYTRDLQMSHDQKRRADQIGSYLRSGMPLQYALGEVDFCGLTLKVDPRVLIPRPETELLIEQAERLLSRHDNRDIFILDLGTGSGNIAISLAKLSPRFHIVAVDVSEGALSLAMHNAQQNAVPDRIKFVHADMKQWLCLQPEKSFSMIVSNPPYIPSSKIPSLPADVQQEPHIALDGGNDGLDFYRLIAAQAGRLLSEGGHFLCEFWDGQEQAIERLLCEDKQHAWKIDLLKDFSCVNRILVAQLHTENINS